MVGQVLQVPPSIEASPPCTQLNGHRIIAVVAKRPVEFDELPYYGSTASEITKGIQRAYT